MYFENEVKRETDEKVIEKIEPTSLQPLICQAKSLENRKVEEEMQ